MTTTVAVTGITGFIAGHAVAELLARGYGVRGTVRSRAKLAETKLPALSGYERVAAVEADLLSAEGFRETFAGCNGVLHMASPYTLEAKDPQKELVDPAVKGTLNALEAAAATPSVRRMVLTSSMAAVTDEPDGRVLTEADWNTKSSLARNPYYFAKSEAERAAWDFMKREKPGFDLVVINPFLVIGPSLTPALNTSNQIFVEALTGVFPGVLEITWGMVDVRDVALAHVLALETPAAEGRYLCVAESMTMRQLFETMKPLAQGSEKLPTLALDFPLASRIAKLFAFTQQPGAASYMKTHLGRTPRFDTSKIQAGLGLNYRDIRATIAETVADLRQWKHLT